MQEQVVVVGGGIAGSAVALEVAARGVAVTLVDRDQPGTGATGASAGMLAPQYEAGGPGPAFRLGLESKALWEEMAGRLEALTDWPVGYRVDGMLVANRTREEEKKAEEELAWQHAAGLPGEILSPAEARLLHAGVNPELPSYLWLPREAQVDAQRVAVALTDAVREGGGKVLVGKPALEILREGNRAAGVVLEGGVKVPATLVILAGGAWTPLMGGLPREIPVRPVKGQILRLRPYPPSPWPLLSDHQGRYLVPRENGSLLVGSTMEEVGFDDSVTDEGRAALSECAMELYPGLESARVVERWAGLRPLTPDSLPILGPDPLLEGLHYATGYGRNGILFAPLASRAVADLALEGRTSVEWEPFRVERFGRGH